MFTAYAETYVREENRYKHEQCEQAIARECFQRFAGLQGARDCVGRADVDIFCSYDELIDTPFRS